jgi:hypothetical protein
MRAVEGRLAALIEEFLLEKQADRDDLPKSALETVTVSQVSRGPAANDQFFAGRVSRSPGNVRAWRFGAVFFADYAKKCAKSVYKSIGFAKSVTANKRQRAALAACFFGFFSLFPSDTDSANLSTTP